jgi:hypothetical protein
MFGVLSESASFLREIPMSFAQRFNRFNVKRPAGPASERFHYLLDRGYSIGKALDYSINSKYDVAITGFWRAPNYGGDLTYYALYNVILDMGLEPVFVEACNPAAPPGSPPSPLHMDTKYPLFSIAPWYPNRERQAEINLRVRNVMVGSDQVWNPNLIDRNIVGCYTLDFAASWRNTVAYSSSFGKTEYPVDTPEKEEHVRLLKRIKHVSVREASGVDICARFGIEAKHVLDPVMLCDPVHYKELIANSTITYPDRFLLCFVRHVGEHLNPLRLSAELNEEIINIGGPDIDLSLDHPYLMMNARTVENWVKALSECDYLLTDSFHAVAMAIVLRKPFIAVYGNMSEGTGIDRFRSLLRMFGLEDRFFMTTDEALDSGILSKQIDFDAVGRKLDEYRKDSLQWLEDALEFW